MQWAMSDSYLVSCIQHFLHRMAYEPVYTLKSNGRGCLSDAVQNVVLVFRKQF